MQPGISSHPDPDEQCSSNDRLIVIGVRHHSPACAQLVRRTIEDHRPAFVLIEGPTDFNPHIDDLRLAHQLPLAIFSFHSTPRRVHASYSPFCSYSPEWQALQAAWSTGARPLFCDLPAWHPDFGDRTNRYADQHGKRAAAVERAAANALGEDGRDAFWDAIAEQSPPEELGERLAYYFDLLRPDGAEDPQELARERYMAAHAAWALREAKDRKVVLICGGWHAQAIRMLARQADGDIPAIPPLDEGERAGSYVVPYEYRRLDRFAGYASGMPSPAYYEDVFAYGLDQAADNAQNAIAASLRAAGQVVSTADRVAWHAHAKVLSMARGHRSVLRADLLDAALATLVKDALDLPAAWTREGALRSGTHPALVAMLRALTGERCGKLAPGTRQPPLMGDIRVRLDELGLMPEPRPRNLVLDWNVPLDRERAHLLHALCILGIPGIDRGGEPTALGTVAPKETFRLVIHRDADGAQIEASRWGGTVPMAAAAVLSDRAEHAGDDLESLSACLADALFAGLLALENELTERIAAGLASSHDIRAIGAAGLEVVRLYRFGEVFGEAAHKALGRLCEAVFARVMWIMEVIRNEDEGIRSIRALLACRDMMRDCPTPNMDISSFIAGLERCVSNPETPAALSGAAFGTLIACGKTFPDDVCGRMQRFSGPDRLGDFLSGLFALAREDISKSVSVIGSVTAMVEGWTDEAFLRALPSLRRAFSFFPPRERERLAGAIVRSHGGNEAQAEVQAMAWMRQSTPMADQASAIALEATVARRLAEAGLI
ncbi:DUF5682 family protein [Agrobacterium rosae]|uniref:DUF5682 family protein n=1 Tax=Agrobacterium rosae TaxID=1972867 RepID=A0AAE5VPU7_9HYPH|nr:DUF5682 family protein [Agrobacterium rosae]KAA3511422.1 hypothetical protein DXM21_13190 [Agrobacterium rosae]KAA3519154.1 hypothetical protein DXM25_14835 [Agrobacterium rosae]MCM2436204.1 hypothetical protein [Agrobacterium rosae]MDX8332263.1 DUF5682 family protein [Agrobacterium rosae]MQB49093.1 hypothetical protein [Agrobacterium rosae]